MPQENLHAKYEKLKKDRTLQNYIAQANARYILLNTQETFENFPAYTIENDKLNLLAFHFLNIGASLAESQALDAAREPLEQGAALLEFVHGAHTNRIHTSEYFGLISALAYYVSFQYSKSFILIRKLVAESKIANFISLFIQRDFSRLSQEVKSLKVNNEYSDEFLAENYDEIDGATRIFELQIGLALNNFLNHFWTGEDKYIYEAKETLATLKDIAELKDDPGIWWVIRLLLLISDGIVQASLWSSLRQHYNMSDDLVPKYIYSLAYQKPNGYHELFVTQRQALKKVASSENKGSVISMPTSSGKTRIAELAILDSLSKNQNSKVLYIAPFRSLAFEIENSFEKILGSAGINISHLYGGGLFNKLDEAVIEESDVIIATPEKAKALLRSREDILNEIKLVIIDEGHLLGSDNRHTVNELFYEELRHFVHSVGGKFVVLSAVLPNAEDIARWLNDDKDTVVKSNWRPSDERLGILEWTGEAVNLDWKNNDDQNRPTFNNRFIVKRELPWKKYQRQPKFFPENNNEAIAATANKLETFGTMLIFVGLRSSVFVMGRSYMKCFGESEPDHEWKNLNDWKSFELACIETYGENNEWLLFARKGILCHSGELQNDVRIPLERLMRSEKPRVIIATSTLAQGVNLGVSSVIFASIYQAGELISARDFWNIAGRAGRAFTDFEGKILVSSDESDKTCMGRFKTESRRAEIHEYFKKESINLAHSGLLSALIALNNLTQKYNINFETLLELISNNQLGSLDEDNDDDDDSNEATNLDKKLDLVDDALLSIKYFISENDENSSSVEDYFKKSLAYIQATNDDKVEEGHYGSNIWNH
jgi:replicative superfamily II helicase